MENISKTTCIIAILYGCFRLIYEEPIPSINTMSIYLILIISWVSFKAFEEKIKIKYHT